MEINTTMEEKKMNIVTAKESIKSFLEEHIGSSAQVLKVAKTDDGWAGEAEIYEDSSFIKSLGLKTNVRDRNIYVVELTDDMEIISYGRKEENEEE
jgi:hypothetical protein